MSSDQRQFDGAGAELVLAGDPGLALLAERLVTRPARAGSS